MLETIDIIAKTVEENPQLCPISPPLLRDLLTLCTTNVQFLFNGIFYRQIDGVAMGSPLGCLFANIFMGFIEERLYNTLESHCSFYCRFIDDTFALMHDETSARLLLDVLNTAHNSLHFTHECEREGVISFLDVKVIKHPIGSFGTAVHRKPTFSGVYLNFNSFVPVRFKRGLVRTLFLRAIRICSPEFLQCEFDFITEALKRNAYPEYFINRYRVLQEDVKEKPLIAEKKPIYLQLPFYGDQPAARLRQKLLAIVGRVFYAAKPVILFSTTRIPVASPKDRLSNASSSSIIYSFRCGCGTATYIGRTSRALAQRSREHIPRWLERGLHGQCRSSITEHVLDCDCDRSSLMSSFSVVCRARNDPLLRILEALFIKRDRPNLCRQKDYVTDLRLPW